MEPAKCAARRCEREREREGGRSSGLGEMAVSVNRSATVGGADASGRGELAPLAPILARERERESERDQASKQASKRDRERERERGREGEGARGRERERASEGGGRALLPTCHSAVPQCKPARSSCRVS